MSQIFRVMFGTRGEEFRYFPSTPSQGIIQRRSPISLVALLRQTVERDMELDMRSRICFCVYYRAAGIIVRGLFSNWSCPVTNHGAVSSPNEEAIHLDCFVWTASFGRPCTIVLHEAISSSRGYTAQLMIVQI